MTDFTPNLHATDWTEGKSVKGGFPRPMPQALPEGARLHVITAIAPPIYFRLADGRGAVVRDGGQYLDGPERRALKGARPVYRRERRALARAKGVTWPLGGWGPS